MRKPEARKKIVTTSKKQQPKLVIVGTASIDRIVTFPDLYENAIQPDRLKVLSISFLADMLKETPGGIGANICYGLSLLKDKPIMYGSVGENARGYLKKLARLGTDTSYMHYSKLPTGTFTVITDKNHCQVGAFYPGAMSESSSLTIKKFKHDDVFVVICPHDPKQMDVQVQECATLKKRMCYDIGQQVINVKPQQLKNGINTAELLIVNDYEMGVLVEKTGWTQEQILKKVKTVVVTLGEKGAAIYQSGLKSTIKAATIKKVVDPTGAGDAFRSGFFYGYIRDLDPTTCAKLGAISAAFCVESFGTQEHTYTPQTFKARFIKNYGTYPLK